MLTTHIDLAQTLGMNVVTKLLFFCAFVVCELGQLYLYYLPYFYIVTVPEI